MWSGRNWSDAAPSLTSLELLLTEGKISQEVFVQLSEKQEEEKKRQRTVEVLKQRINDDHFTAEQREAYQKKLDELELE